MKNGRIVGFSWMVAGIWVAALLSLCGCEKDRYDHKPPEGKGAIIVENNTSDRLRVYIDGVKMDRVNGWKHRAYDCEPGVRRVTLDGDSVRRAWSGDVDVRKGKERLTVLVVQSPLKDSHILNVRYYFD